MVASIDGRIDCSMVDKISGEEYYTALEQLDCPSLLEGRVTMEHYNAAKGLFVPKVNTPVGETSVYVAEESDAYMVSVDTTGHLCWNSNRIDDVPLICIVSEKVYRVGQEHYCPLPPSEPYMRVSPHTAQAFLSLCSCAETGSYYFLFPLVLRDNLKHSS